MRPRRWFVAAFVAAAATAATAACSRGFQVKDFPTPGGLFAASLAQYKKGKWDNAVTGFERLTLDLSARDTLLPLAHWYLAQAHDHRDEHLLAATGFSRLAESFPDDTLADDGLYASGMSYLALWRRPELDPQYGTLAQVQFRQMIGVYPDSPLAKQAQQRLLDIDELFADKDYRNGGFYLRRRAYDSAIIYFKDVVKDYPNTDHARLALLEMLKVYRLPQMNYREEAAETCVTLRAAYQTDKDVLAMCPPVAADSTRRPPAPPPSAGPATRPAR